MDFGKYRNKLSKDLLKKRIDSEDFERQLISFYRYVDLGTELLELRHELYLKWLELGVLGRIYIAREGINAQISVPVHNIEKFRAGLESYETFKNMPFKIGIHRDKYAFLKLTLKIKKQIVADDLPFGTYDVTDVGKHLTAQEFNEAMSSSDAVVVDMRNHYESRIGKFEGAITPDSDTFREELLLVKEQLKGREDKKVLLYCTGGVRCEKASSFLKSNGFKDVSQLHGGIINYFHEVKEKGLESKFKGKNFVFDGRTAEKITDDVLTRCDQCGSTCDDFVNCANPVCNLLFIQCQACAGKFENCCCEKCVEISKLPKEERKKVRSAIGASNFELYKKRIRPNLMNTCCNI